jgi:hypothetical protein
MDTREGVMAGDNRAEFIINKEKLMDWNPTDYPKEDSQSQKAPGGLLHAEALEAFKSGSYH